MAAEKRPASNVFGSSQIVVKRQKSDANLNGSNAVAVTNGSSANGALIQSVRGSPNRFSSLRVGVEIGLELNDVKESGLMRMGGNRYRGRVGSRPQSWS